MDVNSRRKYAQKIFHDLAKQLKEEFRCLYGELPIEELVSNQALTERIASFEKLLAETMGNQ